MKEQTLTLFKNPDILLILTLVVLPIIILTIPFAIIFVLISSLFGADNDSDLHEIKHT